MLGDGAVVEVRSRRAHHVSVGLDKAYARRTLENLHALWKRPVHVRTFDGRGKPVTWVYDGETFGNGKKGS